MIVPMFPEYQKEHGIPIKAQAFYELTEKSMTRVLTTVAPCMADNREPTAVNAKQVRITSFPLYSFVSLGI